MASNELVAFENTLRPLTPHFEQALGKVMPVERLMRSIMISVERNPKLLTHADRQSLLNASMSAACLGLEVDGITGQAFFIPFAGRAQLVIGYKGMNTLAARSGFTVQGEVVREGDEFDYELGDRGYVRHKPKLGNTGKIIGAWATASATNRPAIISVMGIDDIMAVKNKSPGGKKSDSPWNDPAVGFPAMASKTVKRRLARSMPLNVMQIAAALEEGFEERGRATWIDPERGLQIEGEAVGGAAQIHHEQRGTVELLAPHGEDWRSTDAIPSAAEYIEQWRNHILAATSAKTLHEKWMAETEMRRQIEWPDLDERDGLIARVKKAIESMKVNA